MNFTLIAYKPEYSYTTRCGDNYYDDADFQILYSQDKEEIATKLAEFKSIEVREHSNEYELTLLINGVDCNYTEDFDMEQLDSEIRQLAETKISSIVEERRIKKEQQEAQEAAQKALRERNARLADEQRQRELYASLHKRFGGQ